MADNIEVNIGGKSRRLKFTRRTQFRAGRVNDLLGSGGAVAVSAMVWCLLDEPNPSETPEDIWAAMDDDDLEPVADAVRRAWEEGQGSAPGKPKKRKRSSSSKSD